jgi:hypothetical protein
VIQLRFGTSTQIYAAIAQLGERQTEDLKVAGSIPARGILFRPVRSSARRIMTRVGFEPTPFRTTALTWRLRPLGHLAVYLVASLLQSKRN